MIYQLFIWNSNKSDKMILIRRNLFYKLNIYLRSINDKHEVVLIMFK